MHVAVAVSFVMPAQKAITRLCTYQVHTPHKIKQVAQYLHSIVAGSLQKKENAAAITVFCNLFIYALFGFALRHENI